jgi:flavin reductase (DIM6/NTAB) family NADH-FMN oxidoreductase RutF
MSDLFTPCRIKLLKGNLFSMLDDEWMLITAGTKKSFNTMTASWGGFGILWNKPVAFIFIRPQRHTLGFVDREDFFTLSFFEEKYRDILSFCGSRSGREVDKVAETGLVPVETQNGAIYFEQAKLILECSKLYRDKIRPENFMVRELEKKIYRQKDYHFVYVAEIDACMVRK